jgi:hypothetical protein
MYFLNIGFTIKNLPLFAINTIFKIQIILIKTQLYEVSSY